MRRPLPLSAGRTLKKPHEYKKVYNNGRLIRGHYLWVYALPASSAERLRPGQPALGKRMARAGVRIGISISKGRIKKAAERNRLKRIIRGWHYQETKVMPKGSCDLVVVVKKAPQRGRAGSLRIRQEISALFAKVDDLL